MYGTNGHNRNSLYLHGCLIKYKDRIPLPQLYYKSNFIGFFHQV